MTSEARGQVTVLLGIDGAGKTTILEELAKRGFSTSSWKRLALLPLPRVTSAEYSTVQYLRGLPYGNYVNNLQPFSRAAFVLSLIFAEYEYLIKPCIDAGIDVLTDTYYIRPLAKELVKGRTIRQMIVNLGQLPKPDLVIHLGLTPETAFHRKRGLVSEHETMHEKTLDDFVLFQNLVERACVQIVAGMNCVTIDASQSTGDIVEQILKTLEKENAKAEAP